ncbi:unnamed protein product [Penicillium egyptiacum]|uniref:CFEM domain-containing protein n=1 Tax=Penicillium egyptiacum TaxID=1303716 RepID=A0A9W4KG38_9EURO|nr:unnamed protein product [Penicillium egyptiacum]
MKFSTTLIALVAAGLASAQLPNVPACSLSCFLSALQSDGCSELLDFACHCQKTELVSSITPCVEKACEYKDQVSVSNAVVDQCSSAGHPISIPPIETSASSSASASSSVPAETTATPTESASESSSAVESTSAVETGSTTTGTTATGSKPVGSSSGAATSTPLVSKTGSASPSASSPAFNGAANVKGNLAGVAALAAAAAYVL